MIGLMDQIHYARISGGTGWARRSRITNTLRIAAVVSSLALPLSALPAQASPSQVVTQLADGFMKWRGGSFDNPTSLSIEKTRRDSAYGHDLIARTRAVDTTALTREERLTLDVVAWEGWKLEQQPRLYWYSFSLLPVISPIRELSMKAQARTFRTPQDLDTYLTLLDSVASTLDQLLVKARAQAARKIVLPRGLADMLIAYYSPLMQPTGDNPFVVSAERLAALPAGQANSIRTAIASRITARIAPSANAVVAYVDSDVRLHGSQSVGLAQYPGGREAYRILIKSQTTFPDTTPEDVYQHGLDAIASIDAQMTRLRDSLGFHGSKAEFNARLENDKRFYETEPDAVGQRYLAAIHRLEPLIPRYFDHLPKAPYGVRRLDRALEPVETYGHYNPPIPPDSTGYYNFNGSQLDKRSMLEGAAIIYHELIPGHHFQINLALENGNLPPLRRTVYYPGFGEGWGEYASSVVAREAGMYKDPYDLYGRLAFDAFFAARLVVDVGMNYYGWSRERAMAYMKEYTLESDAQIDSETWRYSVRTPAQATAYRMGRDAILAMRQKAEKELGSRFDIRKFHDAVLGSGSLPLFLFQRNIDLWLAQEGAGPR